MYIQNHIKFLKTSDWLLSLFNQRQETSRIQKRVHKKRQNFMKIPPNYYSKYLYLKCFSFSIFQKLHLFLAAFCSLCLTTFTQGQLQFSDLIGSETVRAEQVKVTATKNNAGKIHFTKKILTQYLQL